MSRVKIDISEYENISQLYNSGLSMQKIANTYGVSSENIKNILKKCNVKIRDNSHKGRLYTLNENYFDDIDSNNKAYILGLLYSDGCNYTPLNHVKLELQERDKAILDAINFEMGSNRPLRYNDLHSKNANWQSTYCLSIVNKHMSSVLNELGMVQNKSLILEFPEWLDQSLYASFIRGYMDGDGHIHVGDQSKFITCVGTKMFCEGIKRVCENILNIHPNILDVSHNKNSITKLLSICGKDQMKIFLDYIYANADLYIERKYNTYKLFCEYYYNTNNSLSV